MTETFGLSGDLSSVAIALAIGIAALGLALLVVELRRSKVDGAWLVASTGLLATGLALAALLRPVHILSRGSLVGPKVVVLVDRSRSMLLPDNGATRDARAKEAVQAIRTAAKDARVSVIGYGDRTAPIDDLAKSSPDGLRSDLASALREVVTKTDEMPSAIVVVGDGRFDAPSSNGATAETAAILEGRSIPVHAVSVAEREPKDASVRAVRTTGATVAHQPMSLTVEVGCAGGLACDALPVTVRELLDGAPPHVLASGTAKVENGIAVVDLGVTLDRAGPRLVEVAVEAPEGDEIPDNDRRILVFDVARERVRLLHVAGHPTYDVRALRMWLKANASVDVVAFFILRTEHSDVVASDNELALIRFPVDELFTEHLPSFDAVILQDFNAVPYRLVKYLPNLTSYVERGGGLVMVGGPDAFLGGHYDGTELERVLPVKLDPTGSGAAFDLADVVPRATPAGRGAPMLGPLRALFGDELPPMPGCNLVGAAKPGAITLWEHPSRKTREGTPMPLLTLGEFGDGRSVAIALDGVHRLGFSEFAARYAGRGHGALWDGLLGWLMRDPRFEPAQVEIPRACVAGEPMHLRVTPLPGTTGTIAVEVAAASEERSGATVGTVEIPPNGGPVDVAIGTLSAGGYLAKVKVGTSGATRRAFACETGGDEWADSRPDEERLRAIAKAGHGSFVRAKDARSLRFPPATLVSAERTVSPVLPPWAWTLMAAMAMGGHWIARRRAGLV